MTLVDKTKLARIHVLLASVGKLGVKADYVIDATNGREHSFKYITNAEADKIIQVLVEEERAMNLKKNDKADKMRKKIIGCLREAGYNVGGKADMKAIYAWVLKYGYLHKPLNEYTAGELPVLVTQAQAVKNTR